MSEISTAVSRGYDDYEARNFQNPYKARHMRRAWAAGFRQAAQEQRVAVRARHLREDDHHQAVR